MNRRIRPNPRPWDLQDIENWFETETGISKGSVSIVQKDRQPLEKPIDALRRELGVTKCQIRKTVGGVYELRLGIEASARVARVMAGRVKMKKACKDVELVMRAVWRRRKVVQQSVRRAREILTLPYPPIDAYRQFRPAQAQSVAEPS